MWGIIRKAGAGYIIIGPMGLLSSGRIVMGKSKGGGRQCTKQGRYGHGGISALAPFILCSLPVLT